MCLRVCNGEGECVRRQEGCRSNKGSELRKEAGIELKEVVRH